VWGSSGIGSKAYSWSKRLVVIGASASKQGSSKQKQENTSKQDRTYKSLQREKYREYLLDFIFLYFFLVCIFSYLFSGIY
jgi:hypothetical protein